MKYQLFLLLTATFFVSGSRLQAQPVLTKTDLRGIQIGASTELNLSGRGLKKGTQVKFPFACTQKTISENGSSALTVQITLSEDVKPGLYPLRVFNEDGLSDPILIGVDRLPQRKFDTAKQTLPVALTGDIAGARILKSSFEAKKGELIVLEIEANRLGGKLRPVIHLYDHRGKQVAFGRPSRFLGGDARCFLSIPENGIYNVELHDFLFRGASPGLFRLKIGAFQYADLTLPIAVQSGQKTPLRMIKIDAESEFLEEVMVVDRGWVHANATGKMFSGAVPQIFSSDIREFVETAESDKPVKVGAVPVGINGRLSTNREVDKFLIDVEPNSKLTFDLFGRRLGSPIDAKIRIMNSAGGTLAQNDDRKGEQDALLNYTVPGNVKQIVVEVSDVAAKGSKAHVYRLDVRKQNRPRVSVAIDKRTFNVAKGGTLYVPVKLTRTSYAGPVQLVFQGLPKSVEVNGATIPAGADVGLLTFSSVPSGAALFTIQATIQKENKVSHFDVLGPESAFSKGMDALRKQFGIASIASKNLSIAWKDENTKSLTGFLGSNSVAAVKVQRGANVKGPIRVRLITDQKIPKKRVRKNNKDTFVDDVEKTIRANAVELADGKSEASLSITIPNGIDEGEWNMLLVAEHLSADKKNVLLSSSTRSLKLTTQRLASVQLKKGKIIDLPRSGKGSFQVSGTIQRTGEPLACRVSIGGLPKGVQVAPSLVDASKDEFDIAFEVPVNAELLKLKSLTLDFAFLKNGDPNTVVGMAKTQKVKVKVAPAPAKQPKGKEKKK